MKEALEAYPSAILSPFRPLSQEQTDSTGTMCMVVGAPRWQLCRPTAAESSAGSCLSSDLGCDQLRGRLPGVFQTHRPKQAGRQVQHVSTKSIVLHIWQSRVGDDWRTTVTTGDLETGQPQNWKRKLGLVGTGLAMICCKSFDFMILFTVFWNVGVGETGELGRFMICCDWSSLSSLFCSA